jgi:hypothetical protein
MSYDTTNIARVFYPLKMSRESVTEVVASTFDKFGQGRASLGKSGKPCENLGEFGKTRNARVGVWLRSRKKTSRRKNRKKRTLFPCVTESFYLTSFYFSFLRWRPWPLRRQPPWPFFGGLPVFHAQARDCSARGVRHGFS